MPVTLPQLVFENKNLGSLIHKYYSKGTVVLADSYNYPKIKDIDNLVEVVDCDIETINTITADYSSNKIIAVGGCTVLDVGRACSDGKELICIPTILSTTCVSCDRSRIKYPDNSKLIKTNYPLKTIISWRVIKDTSKEDLIKWSESGFGDLFANISASIDLQFQRQDLGLPQVKQNVPGAFRVLKWVNTNFKTYDTNCLKVLVKYIHSASIDVIVRDSVELSAGSEHILYHKIVAHNPDYKKAFPTHGQIVAIGTLITAKIFSLYQNEGVLFNDLRNAYIKLGLPVSYSQMELMGINRAYLKYVLESFANGEMILGNYFTKNGFEILDTIFNG